MRHRKDNEIEHVNGLVDAVRDRYIAEGDLEARYWSNLLYPLTDVRGACFIAIFLFQAGQIDTGDIVAYVGIVILFQFPGVCLAVFTLPRIALGYASASRILSIINAETDLDQNEAGYAHSLKGEITI